MTEEPGGLPSVGSQSRTRLRRRGSGSSVRCSTVLLFFSRVWLCVNPSLQHAGYPVLHHFPELAQAHVHRVGDATQPSHPLLPLLLLPSIFPSIRVFSNESALPIRWPEYWSFSFSISPSNEYSGLISFRMDWFDLLAVQGTLTSLLKHHSSKASILWRSLFYGPTLTSVHDCWKNHSFDYRDLSAKRRLLFNTRPRY